MRKLIIETWYPEAVKKILKKYDLVENFVDYHDAHTPLGILATYPDDLLSQEIVFWFALAQGCGLIEQYEVAHW